MILTLTPVQEANIQTYLYAMPADIKENIKECTDKWLNGESAYGYPHPVHVCEKHPGSQRQASLFISSTTG